MSDAPDPSPAPGPDPSPDPAPSDAGASPEPGKPYATDLDRASNPRYLRKVSDERLRGIITTVATLRHQDRKVNNLVYYEPASEECMKVHLSRADVIGVGGGNRSSKTETVLVDFVACATGVFPESLRDVFKAKFRGPINCRIIVESFTTHLYPVFLPKLRWWTWSGIDQPGGERGHWGWIPKACLIEGSWDKSWSNARRELRVYCRDPEDPDRVLGESTFQFMSKDQDPTEFASGTFHRIMHDEPPTYAIWKESQARVLDTDGQLYLAMTWPDDASIAVDWIFDEIYEPGSPGPLKNPDTDWFELSARSNQFLDQEVYERKTAGWSEVAKSVRRDGKPIRFSNRVHKLFSDVPRHWCFVCERECHSGDEVHCGCERNETDICSFNHVGEYEPSPLWPTVWLLDPHPRKPHMWCWVQVDPNDDYWVVGEGQAAESPAQVRKAVHEWEEANQISIAARIMDPNMGASPANAREREQTWQAEFASAGLWCELADDSSVGRERLNEFLTPDIHTRRPRIHFADTCQMAAGQFKRYVWDDFRESLEKDQKQTPRGKYDDYPTLLKYLMNAMPTFHMLQGSGQVLNRRRRALPGYG